MTTTTSMRDLNVCRANPIRDAKTVAAVRAYRKTAAFNFLPEVVREPEMQLPPIDVYAVAFGLEPDSRINERVQKMFANEAALIMNSIPYDKRNPPDALVYTDAPGWIYVFHDIGDPANVVKIGRTTQTPRQRLAQWERELSKQPDKSLFLLTAYKTAANKFAERVVFELLRCQRISNRINPLTNDELDEFFTIDNMMALKIFLRLTMRFIDRYCRFWFERRRAQMK